MPSFTAFKAYDIRGLVPEQLNNDLAYQIGRALSAELNPKEIVVGHDIRLESPDLCRALCQGLTDSGVNAIYLGLCGTEEVYFATSHYQADGGVMITASHNPKGYNGMKLVGQGSRPISGASGLNAIKTRIQRNELAPLASQPGKIVKKLTKQAYINHLLGFIDRTVLKPLKIVVNAGNGAAGPTFDQIAQQLPFEFIRINHEPNGDFPNGIPNPMIVENRNVTAKAVLQHQADLGIAWDGDFDRCFLFDEKGQFIEGYYLVGLLAETLLKKYPGEKIIYDPRLTWNTIEQVKQAGGKSIQSKTGHAFIKETMRLEDAIYGGEMSAHHYFKDFFYCDSGMIPWLLITELVLKKQCSLSSLVKARALAYPCSGELNYEVNHSEQILQDIENKYAQDNPNFDRTDGLGMKFSQWRLNIRLSNTEPLLRLNVESRGDPQLVAQKVAEIEKIIGHYSSSIE